MKMKIMITLTLNRNTLVTGHLAGRAGRLEGELADGAGFGVLDVPFPGCYGLPAVYFYFHALFMFVFMIKLLLSIGVGVGFNSERRYRQ